MFYGWSDDQVYRGVNATREIGRFIILISREEWVDDCPSQTGKQSPEFALRL